MPAGITIVTTTMSRGTNITNLTPPPLAGGGWGEGAVPPTGPPPPSPLPQGEGEDCLLPSRALLRLLAWLSPAFPTGAYAYSHGLEWAVECGDIADGDTLHIWLADVLIHGSGRNDAILLRHAHRERGNHAALNDLAAAIAPSRERRTETLDQGTAFIAAASAWLPPELPERVAYPVAVGALSGRHGIDEDATTAAYLQAVITNLISAAVRLVPLGQTTGLRVLLALEPAILRVASESRAATLDDLGGCTFRSDLAAMHHETQYTRLFRS